MIRVDFIDGIIQLLRPTKIQKKKAGSFNKIINVIRQ